MQGKVEICGVNTAKLPVYNNIDAPRVKPNLKVSVISNADFRD